MNDLNLESLLSKAKEMQKSFEEKQNEAAERKYEVSVGGGMVKTIINGKQEMLSISIEKELLDPEKLEMLEDLIRAAVNESMRKSKQDSDNSMKQAMTDGLPDDIKNLFS